MTISRSGASRPPPWLLYAITATGITVNSLVTPAIPDILRAFGAPRAAAGLVVASVTFPGIFLAPVIGILADRYGRREVLVPCLLLYGAAGAAAAAAPSLGALVALRLVQGVASAGLVNLAVVLIGDHWDGLERARMIGRNSAVLTVSILLLPPLGGALTQLGGWRAPFVAYAASGLTAVAAWRLPRSAPRRTRLRDQLAGAAVFLRSRAMALLVASGVVVFVLIFGPMLTVLPLHLEGRFGLGPGARGLLQGLPAVSATIGSLCLGALKRKVGRRRLQVSGMAAFAAALAIIGVASSLPLLAAGVLLFGAGEGVVVPALQDLAAGLAPASSRGTVVAVWVAAARTGQTLGPLVASAALAITATGRTFLYGAALAAMAAAAGAVTAAGGRAPKLPAGDAGG